MGRFWSVSQSLEPIGELLGTCVWKLAGKVVWVIVFGMSYCRRLLSINGNLLTQITVKHPRAVRDQVFDFVIDVIILWNIF